MEAYALNAQGQRVSSTVVNGAKTKLALEMRLVTLPGGQHPPQEAIDAVGTWLRELRAVQQVTGS